MTGFRLGVVTDYDPHGRVAAVQLEEFLRIGDRVAIRDANGGVHLAVERLECENCDVRLAEAGKLVRIRVPQPVEAGSFVEMEQEAAWP